MRQATNEGSDKLPKAEPMTHEQLKEELAYVTGVQAILWDGRSWSP